MGFPSTTRAQRTRCAPWTTHRKCCHKATIRSERGLIPITAAQATDSAAAATALYTGFKTTQGRMGTDASGERPWTTVAELAESLNKRTGVVTSVEVSHATPGAMWSHKPSRSAYAAIFNEMLGGGLDVIMGAGHPRFDNNGVLAEPDYQYVGGEATWQDLTDADGLHGFAFIDTKTQFEKLAAQAGATPASLPSKVVGIAQCRETLQYCRAGSQIAPHCPLNSHVPSLETMARGAIAVLSQQPEGFLLMIEGGAVDWANHDHNLPRMVEEQVDFNRTVAAVIDWIATCSSWDETLLIITSDHECGMLWGPTSYNDANGNGQRDEDEPLRTFGPIENRGAGQLPAGCYLSGGHTNALVPLWAKGAGSEVFHQLVDGIDEQAGRFWGFSGKYVDNTDVFRVIHASLCSSVPAAPTTSAGQ